ncbi:hypothetical protein [Rubricoccus marinus]|uniref:Lipocalin-like domain-containing protein n=1 Tax=Rubricoccus marinus TaxID=716817 RepID=A0A259U047_9BACT|nr:hypothetical protein [Rubricoccus marinus]OZC03403.1 hypothetical protein BSZ36_10670 [Rubricoccus marinus]
MLPFRLWRIALALPFLLAAAASAQTLDPHGAPSAIESHRDVLLGETSIVGRWDAVEVRGDRSTTLDLRLRRLAKTLIVNPTGRATLRGWDERLNGGRPEAFVGTVARGRLRLEALPGAARLALHGGRLWITDPSGTTTVYAWRGR